MTIIQIVGDKEEKLEDLFETRGVEYVPGDELLIYMCRITTRARALREQADVIEGIVNKLLAAGAEYVEEPVSTLMSHLDDIDFGLGTLASASEGLAERVVEEL